MAMTAEERAREAWQALRAEPELDAAALARIGGRLAESRPRRRLVWQPATVVVVLLTVAGIAGATIGFARRSPRSIAPPAPEPRKQILRKRVLAPALTAAPAVAPPPARPARKVAAAPPPPAAPPDDGAEVRLFSAVVRTLQQERDAHRALALIEQYAARYPAGHFAGEAIVMKIDALQSLGRKDEALAILRQTTLAGLPRSGELHLLRAELSAEAGRCDDALVDLEHVLAGSPPPELAERARYWRAACRARLGDRGR
jgi:hypothetical protein